MVGHRDVLTVCIPIVIVSTTSVSRRSKNRIAGEIVVNYTSSFQCFLILRYDQSYDSRFCFPFILSIFYRWKPKTQALL